MPYNTGILLGAGTANIANSVDKISDILCPMMSDFFGEKVSATLKNSNNIAFTIPVDVPFVLYGSQQWFLHLMSDVVTPSWKLDAATYGSTLTTITSDLPLMYHIATNKSNSVMSLGVGFSLISEPFFTTTFVKKTGESYIAIQHGVTDTRSGVNTSRVKDVYYRSETDYKMTFAKASGGYYSDSKLALVPAVDPWTGDVIPDLYLSVLRPKDTRSVRNLISINGRQFISGMVTDSNDAKYIQAMPVFIEI